MKLNDKVALITGGSQGIGESIARRFAAEGARIAVVASSDVKKAQRVADQLGSGKARGYACNVCDAGAVAKLTAQIATDFGRIDILVNSAGVFYPTPVGSDSTAADRMFDINLKGSWNAINAVAPVMKAQKSGKIINISSICGVMGFGTYAVYCATKGGIIMMTRALACELAPHGINVNCIGPGNTATPMNENIRTDPALRPMLDMMAARTPSGRTYSEAEDMANIALFLASDDARAMHGSFVLADEGFSAGM